MIKAAIASPAIVGTLSIAILLVIGNTAAIERTDVSQMTFFRLIDRSLSSLVF